MFLNFGKHTLYYLRCVLIKITVNLLDFILNKILHELHVSPASRIFLEPPIHAHTRCEQRYKILHDDQK